MPNLWGSRGLSISFLFTMRRIIHPPPFFLEKEEVLEAVLENAKVQVTQKREQTRQLDSEIYCENKAWTQLIYVVDDVLTLQGEIDRMILL